MTELFFAAGLSQALGTAAGVLNAIGFLAAFGCLIGASLSGMGERGIQGIKIALILAIVAGLAFLIAQAIFAAGGATPNITPQPIN